MPTNQTYSLISRGDGVRGTLTFSEPYSDDGGKEFIALTAVLYNFPEEFKESRGDFDFSGYTFGSQFENKGNLLEISKFFIQNELNPDLKLYGLKGDMEIDSREVVEAQVEYVYKSKIIDETTQLPVEGAKVIDTNGNSTLTNKSGEFELKSTSSPESIPKLEISSPSFSQKFITPITKDGEVKENLSLISLRSNKIELDNAIRSEIVLPEAQIRAIQLSETDFEMAKQQAMNKIVEQIKIVLIPQVLTLIAQFGISKAQDMIGKKFGDMNATCPVDLEELNKLIKKKNNLTKALNNIYDFLNTVKVGVEIIDKSISVAQIAVQVIQGIYFMFPVAGFGAPDVSKPLAKIIDKIEQELRKYKLISSGTLLVLTILIQILQRVLEYLSLLDSLVNGCAIEGALSQEELNENLISSIQPTDQQTLQSNRNNVNGFELTVINAPEGIIGNIQKRKAIAKNKAGITMLQGEPSFSSNDQILIDELKFHIQQNDLKAY